MDLDVSAVDVVEEGVDVAHVGGGGVSADKTAVGIRVGHPVRGGAGTLPVVLDGEDRPVAVGVPRPVADHAIPLTTATLPITLRQSMWMLSVWPVTLFFTCAFPIAVPSLNSRASNENVRNAVIPASV